MMTSLGESALTISHSCRGPPTQRRCYYETRYCDSCLCERKETRAGTCVRRWNSQRTEGHLKFLGGFSHWDVLASRDAAALHTSHRLSAAREFISDSQFKQNSSLSRDPWKWLILFDSQAKQPWEFSRFAALDENACCSLLSTSKELQLTSTRAATACPNQWPHTVFSLPCGGERCESLDEGNLWFIGSL